MSSSAPRDQLLNNVWNRICWDDSKRFATERFVLRNKTFSIEQQNSINKNSDYDSLEIVDTETGATISEGSLAESQFESILDTKYKALPDKFIKVCINVPLTTELHSVLSQWKTHLMSKDKQTHTITARIPIFQFYYKLPYEKTHIYKVLDALQFTDALPQENLEFNRLKLSTECQDFMRISSRASSFNKTWLSAVQQQLQTLCHKMLNTKTRILKPIIEIPEVVNQSDASEKFKSGANLLGRIKRIVAENPITLVDKSSILIVQDGTMMVETMVKANHESDKIISLKQKTVVILRGIPGSGKSTFINSVISNATSYCICSADHYFINPQTQKYHFNFKKLKQAHEACQKSFREAVNSAVDLVIIDNTNTQRWEYEVYESFVIDNAPQYNVIIVEMHCEGPVRALTYAHRNSHLVDVAKVLQMNQRWEHDSRAVVISQPPLLLTSPKSLTFIPPVQLMALFLTPDARDTLLRTFPPKFQRILAHHVTISYRPSAAMVAECPIGSEFEFKVTAYATDTQVDAVLVQFLPKENSTSSTLVSINQYPHITLSTTSPSVPPSGANTLFPTSECVNGPILTGVLGVTLIDHPSTFVIKNL